MGTLRLDLLYALRNLRRDAGFTTFAVLIVAFGIGASSLVFSVVNTVLLQPLPFRDAHQLVWIANSDKRGLSEQTTQVGYLLDLQQQSTSFSDIGAYMAFYGVGDTRLTGSGEPERLSAAPVSQNFFSVLGVQPLYGRQFNAEESKWHGAKAAILSHGFWERRFGSDPSVVGRTLILNDEPTVVAGVLPATFDFPSVFAPGTRIDLFVPFPLSPETNRWGNTLAIVGRLKPGVPVATAQAEVLTLATRLTREHPERNSFGGKLRTLSEQVSGRMRPALMVLSGAVAVVMLIVCANLSNLLLARTTARHKEIAVRAALGASRSRLVRQVLTESMTLSLCGAVTGALLALAGTQALSRLNSMNIPLLRDVHTDFTALAFILAAALLTGILFGLAPALQTPQSGLHDALKDSARGSTLSRNGSWLRSGLVITEIAFACVLLVGAGLLIRSFLHVLDINLGFQPERAAAMRVDPDSRYTTQAQRNAYFDELLRRVKAVPGVTGAGLTDALPLGRNRSWGAGAKGQTYERGKFPIAFVRLVSDGYLSAMGIPLEEGRDLSVRDVPETEPVILINRTMARTLFPNESALGKIIRACGERRVVGVAGDVRHLALEQNSGLEMYLPLRQCQDISSVDLVVRTALPPAQLAGAVRAAIRPLDPNLPGNDFRPLQSLVDRAVSPRRFVVVLLSGFAAFALLLASLGIYAVISYSVNQRTQEIGIRMALGATAARLQMRIVGETLALAGTGMFAGAMAAWALARVLSSFLFGVGAADPLTFSAMAGLLTVVSLVAGYLPARRAANIDPISALRAE